MPQVPPIRREVRVPAPARIAFDIFTEDVGSWWPLHSHGVFHDGTVAFADGRIVETAADGREATWGSVTAWEPGERVAFTWHPGHGPDRASRIEVTFAADGDDTLVVLTHSGWEVFADAAAAREEYDHGWPLVLGRYVERLAA